MANDALLNAKKQQNDEFYTLYEYIQKEVNAYLEYNPDTFRDKVVLCPCDDPEWSNFTKFFAQNFETLGLKKLISTGYSTKAKKRKYEKYHQMTIWETLYPQYDPDKTENHGKIFTLTRDINNSGTIDYDDLEWDYLEGDGDFQSEEVCKLRDEADIIVTNPPFSLFKDFIPWAMGNQREILVIGNQNEITYSEVFPLIRENKLWLGATNHGEDMVFMVPEGADVKSSDREKAAKLGYVGNYTRQGNSCWFTNIDHGRRHKPLDLMSMSDNKKYSKYKEVRESEWYKHYDNYDAIEVKYVKAIPNDYDGVMGVSITFLEHYNPDQFIIVGATESEGKGFSNGLWNESSKTAQALLDGKKVYKRLFIKWRHDNGNQAEYRPDSRKGL